MATAAEIRKRVREAESGRLKARQSAALDVAVAHQSVTAAEARLNAARADLRKAVAAAQKLDYSIADLAGVTGISGPSLRSVTTGSNGGPQVPALTDKGPAQG